MGKDRRQKSRGMLLEVVSPGRRHLQPQAQPLRVKYMCDKKCNNEGFKFNEVAGTLVADDGNTHTMNLCRNCFNLSLAERSESKVTNARWETMIEQKGLSGQAVGCFGTDGFISRTWKTCAAKKLLEEATRAVQFGTSWQDESPYKEELELLCVTGECAWMEL